MDRNRQRQQLETTPRRSSCHTRHPHSITTTRRILKHLPDSPDDNAMKHKRLILGSILILLLFSLMLYYSLDHNNHDLDFDYILGHFVQFNMPIIPTTEQQLIPTKLPYSLQS